MPSRSPATVEGRRGVTGRREVLAVLLVGIVVLLTALAGPIVVRWHEAPAWLALNVTPPSQPQPTMPPADDSGGRTSQPTPAWLVTTVRWVAVAALVVLVALLLRYVLRVVRDRWRAIDPGGAPVEPGGAETLDELDEAARSALGEAVTRAGLALREELPPGDAVIAAWLALEHAAGGVGVDRDAAQTATDFTLALLDRTPADPAAARTLLRLYHRARFSDHAVAAVDVGAARAALDVLAVALVRRDLPPPAAGPDSGARS